MTRRLHNSLVALSCSAALLAACLLLASPLKPDADAPGLAAAAQSADAPAQPRAGAHRHRSHALRLPFFSFASRN